MNASKESHNSNMNNSFLLDNDNAKVVNKESCEWIFDEGLSIYLALVWSKEGQYRGQKTGGH